MSEKIALNGNVEAEANIGAGWSAGAIVYDNALKIWVGGTEAITKATCTFTNPNPPFTDTVELEGSSTKLLDNGVKLIRHGDEKTSPQGNKLKANVTQEKLKSV